MNKQYWDDERQVGYSPGTYCEDIQCEHYHAGQFDTYCDSCSAYVFYLWLQEHGYKLLRIDLTELAALLDGLIALTESIDIQVPVLLHGPILRTIDEARALAARIREVLAQEANDAKGS